MNPDELPERDWFQVNYGEQSYRVILHGYPATSDILKMEVLSTVHRALREFHGTQHELAKQSATLKELLFGIAARYPEIQGDRDFLSYLHGGP